MRERPCCIQGYHPYKDIVEFLPYLLELNNLRDRYVVSFIWTPTQEARLSAHLSRRGTQHTN